MRRIWISKAGSPVSDQPNRPQTVDLNRGIARSRANAGSSSFLDAIGRDSLKEGYQQPRGFSTEA